MKKNLLILNYQRVIPPFMITEMNIAKDIFDEIIYLTPNMNEKNGSEYVDSENVKIIEIPRSNWRFAFLILAFILLRKEVLRDVRRALREKRLSAKYFRHLIAFVHNGHLLKRWAQRLLRRHESSPNSWVVMATWFSSEAYAASMLKKQFPSVFAVSLAHSFEVDPVKNDFIDLQLNGYLHKNLDEINFISQVIYETYRDIVMRKYSIQDNNIKVRYLGCLKLFSEHITQPSSDMVFRILSCSGVTPVKRLHLILQAIKNWEIGKLQWTHIGDGPLFEELKDTSSNAMVNNTNIDIRLLGNYPNSEVHKYFLENSVDAFINVSAAEGLPVSLMECMAYGVPAIATDVGGNREIVNKETGILLKKDIEPDELRSKLERFVSLGSTEKSIMRENALRIWSERFNADQNMREFFLECRGD